MSTNGNSNDYPPSLRVCKLYQKKSAKGQVYFNGRWGGAKVALVKTKEVGDDGAPIWALLLSEAPQQKPDEKPTVDVRASSQVPAGNAGRGNFDKQLDDEIPF